MSDDDQFVYLRIPTADWHQIEDDIENMAGGEAEILQDVVELSPTDMMDVAIARLTR